LLLERAAEAMLGKCTRIVHAATPDASSSAITPEYIEQLDHTIRSFATRSLRTITLLYRGEKKVEEAAFNSDLKRWLGRYWPRRSMYSTHLTALENRIAQDEYHKQMDDAEF